MKNDCLFCAIIDGEIPSTKVYEDELCLAFRDINPLAPTHILILPKTHIPSANAIDETNSAVVAHIFELVPRLAAAERLAVVLGTEGDGLAPETIARCDYTVKIPMRRGVDSLNVAAASAVAFYAMA